MTTALVLIDLQNDYFPGGSMELVGAESAVAQAASLLEAFRRRALPIFHIQHLAKRPGATFFLPGSTGAEIHASVRPAAGERVVTKHFPNGFRETTLLEDLRAIGVSKLVVAGMMTHLCVDSTVRAAADLGFQCALAHDACATRNLQFAGQTVDATSVQRAFLAALSGSFATIQSAQALCTEP
jgi:nicotinamidase-related amidase